MKQLTLRGITIEVIRKNIKNMHLAVYPPGGRVRLAVPISANDEAVKLFAATKLGWIKRHQRQFEKQERIGPREFKERESHYFLGMRYLLRIIEHNEPGKVILRSKTYLDLYIRPGAILEQRRKILNEWYRRELKKILPVMIEKWQNRIGVTINFWGIKSMKTNWGTCNIEKKRVWLNLELAKKPETCLEYIVVHELIHLLERHHNEKFKKLMDRFLPNWKQLKDELNRLPISHEDWEY